VKSLSAQYACDAEKPDVRPGNAVSDDKFDVRISQSTVVAWSNASYCTLLSYNSEKVDLMP